MKKSDLKKALKPIVEECIRETLYESGLLSSIISEVVQGVVSGQDVLRERREPAPTPAARTQETQRVDEDKRTEHRKAELSRQKKKLLESIGKEAYNGVDLFEGTTPLKRGGSPSSGGGASQGPFQGVDPSDPGVDIGSLTESLGGVWKKLAKGGKK